MQLVNESQESGVRCTWAKIAESIPWRTGKQCRDRWMTYLNPKIKKLKQTPWTPEEDAIILDGWKKWGCCWSKIARMLKGRPPPHIKNRFYSSLKNMVPADTDVAMTLASGLSHLPAAPPESPSLQRHARACQPGGQLPALFIAPSLSLQPQLAAPPRPPAVPSPFQGASWSPFTTSRPNPSSLRSPASHSVESWHSPIKL